MLPPGGGDILRSYGQKSGRLEEELRNQEGEGDHNRDWLHGGSITSDISVGTEVVSGPNPGELGGIPIEYAPEWYNDTLDTIELYRDHVPVGLINTSDQTAGLHIHFSHPDTHEVQDFAEWLYNRSRDDEWLRVFACSSIADQHGQETAQVFRGNRHVKFNGFPARRPNAVAEQNRASGHYEWRMPEPMTRENFELLMEFLTRAVEDREAAVDWASELVYGGDSRLTSVQRARATGIETYEPPTTIDGLQVVRGESTETHPFHDAVYSRSDMPFIYRVHTEDGRYEDTYYLMVRNSLPTLSSPPEGYGHLFPDGDTDRWVIEDSGDGGLRVTDSETQSDIIEAANAATDDSEPPLETTEATDVLMEAL
jgi:hypothetical protein